VVTMMAVCLFFSLTPYYYLSAFIFLCLVALVGLAIIEERERRVHCDLRKPTDRTLALVTARFIHCSKISFGGGRRFTLRPLLFLLTTRTVAAAQRAEKVVAIYSTKLAFGTSRI